MNRADIGFYGVLPRYLYYAISQKPIISSIVGQKMKRKENELNVALRNHHRAAIDLLRLINESPGSGEWGASALWLLNYATDELTNLLPSQEVQELQPMLEELLRVTQSSAVDLLIDKNLKDLHPEILGDVQSLLSVALSARNAVCFGRDARELESVLLEKARVKIVDHEHDVCQDIENLRSLRMQEQTNLAFGFFILGRLSASPMDAERRRAVISEMKECGCTDEEIANKFGITPQRVSQIRKSKPKSL